MPWTVAGGFTAGAQTAHIALRELGVGEGDTVLVHAAAGAVGTIAAQLAVLWGAAVIRVTPAKRSAARLAELAALYAKGDLRFHVRKTYLLEQAADAHREIETGHGRGKIVLAIDSRLRKKGIPSSTDI